MTTKILGQLEIDHERGVIYFHCKKTGITILRICSLPLIPKEGFLDITHMKNVNWNQRMKHQKLKAK